MTAWRDAWSRSCIKSAGGHWSQFPAAALLDAAFTALVSSSSKEHECGLVLKHQVLFLKLCDVCCPYFTSSLYFWEGLLFLLLKQVITDLGQ